MEEPAALPSTALQSGPVPAPTPTQARAVRVVSGFVHHKVNVELGMFHMVLRL